MPGLTARTPHIVIMMMKRLWVADDDSLTSLYSGTLWSYVVWVEHWWGPVRHVDDDSPTSLNHGTLDGYIVWVEHWRGSVRCSVCRISDFRYYLSRRRCDWPGNASISIGEHLHMHTDTLETNKRSRQMCMHINRDGWRARLVDVAKNASDAAKTRNSIKHKTKQIFHPREIIRNVVDGYGDYIHPTWELFMCSCVKK